MAIYPVALHASEVGKLFNPPAVDGIALLYDIIKSKPSATHVLITTLVDAQRGDGEAATKAILGQNETRTIAGNEVTIQWKANGLASAPFYTAKSIYNDAITQSHGELTVRYASIACGKQIKGIILKTLPAKQ